MLLSATIPYSQEWYPREETASDPRYKKYGVAPKGTADYAFLLHDLYHVKPGGIMTIVLPHGVLFRGGNEEEIRRNLIENNNIDAIIGLPANIFFGTGIPTIVMVLRQKRDRDDVLFVDASKGFIKVGKNNQLRARDIRKIVDAVTERREMPKFSRCVDREEIRKTTTTSISLATSIRQKLMSSGIFTPRCLAAYQTMNLTDSQIGGIYSPRCEMNCSARLMRHTAN